MWVLVPAQGGKGEVGTMAGETHTLARKGRRSGTSWSILLIMLLLLLISLLFMLTN